MKVAIIGGNEQHFALLDKEFDSLIEESGRYLFTVIGGYIGSTEGRPPLSQVWAKERGLPFRADEYKNIGDLIKGITTKADYIIFLRDGSELIDRFIKIYQNTGKHGSVINI